MIDWRIVLGALCSGLALTCWLESRQRLQQGFNGVRWRQRAAFFTALFATSLFVYAARQPLWQTAISPQQEADTAVAPASLTATPTLQPPSIFVRATPALPNTSATSPHANDEPERAYLHIPALGVSQPVIDLALQNGRWDVSALGEQVGRLTGTGTHPGDTLAPVFAGHMTYPSITTLETGAFANLQYATYGTEVIYEINGEKAVYEVDEISRVDPSDVERLYLADGDSILLVTCTDWDPAGGVYANRLVVRAIRTN